MVSVNYCVKVGFMVTIYGSGFGFGLGSGFGFLGYPILSQEVALHTRQSVLKISRNT